MHVERVEHGFTGRGRTRPGPATSGRGAVFTTNMFIGSARGRKTCPIASALDQLGPRGARRRADLASSLSMPDRRTPSVDVVVVAYESRETLRGCVEGLAGEDGIHVIVVDNASSDGGLETIAGLSATSIQSERNGGFAYGCNLGWHAGDAPAVLFLNPDARIDPASVRILAQVLERDASVGAAAPRILHEDGSLDHSLRRFPRLRSTYAKALFLHRLVPRAHWVDEVVRDPRPYEQPGTAEWVSGACVMVRREALEAIGGWDEGFFLYSEDTDLCLRLREAGFRVAYEPSARCVHIGGVSAPRAALTPVHVASRLRYTGKHHGRLTAGSSAWVSASTQSPTPWSVEAAWQPAAATSALSASSRLHAATHPRTRTDLAFRAQRCFPRRRSKAGFGTGASSPRATSPGERRLCRLRQAGRRWNATRSRVNAGRAPATAAVGHPFVPAQVTPLIWHVPPKSPLLSLNVMLLP